MKNWIIYFKVFNKQYKTTVTANNYEEAYNKVRIKIANNTEFCKAQPKSQQEPPFEWLKDCFGFE